MRTMILISLLVLAVGCSKETPEPVDVTDVVVETSTDGQADVEQEAAPEEIEEAAVDAEPIEDAEPAEAVADVEPVEVDPAEADPAE